MGKKANSGFFEPCWVVVQAEDGPVIRRAHEEVYSRLERYEAALRAVTQAHRLVDADQIAREALEDA